MKHCKKIETKKILLLVLGSLFGTLLQAQSAKLKGTVLSENSDVLAGVTVTITNGDGTVKQATTTNESGVFSFSNLDTTHKYQLKCSFIGYDNWQQNNITLAHKEERSLLIRLHPVSKQMDEVLVIGYGEQSRSKVVGAVSKIKNDALQKVAAPSVDLQLAGKMSGVIINQTDGQPGAGAQIIIRGIGTLTAGNAPLIVVDGFPLTEGSNLNAINPSDIEDIDVLKDAASAAIYGSRAANGVIMITTKKGKLKRNFSVSANVYAGFQQQTSGVKLVDAYQFAQFLREARNWGYVSKDPANRSENDPDEVRVTKKINGKSIDGRELRIDDELQAYLDGKPGLTNTNWMDEAFKVAPMYNADLSMYGGNDNTSYYLSLGYFNQEGVVLGTSLKKYTANFNLENKLSKRVKVGINLKPSYFDERLGDQASRSAGALALIPLSFPFYAAYKPDGSLNISEQLINETRKLYGVNVNGTPVENLVATALNVTDNRLRFKIFGNTYLDAEIVKGLTYRLMIGGDYDSYSEQYYYPSNIGAYRVPAPRPDADGWEKKNNITNYLFENTLTYKRSIRNHNFVLLAGHTFQKQNGNYTTATGTGYPDNNIPSVAGASNFSVVPSTSIWTLESYLGRIQYDYDARYLLSVAFRTDGSSRFGVNNRWAYFPSVSLGWIASKEAFFPVTDLLSFAKLSASWGKTGNNQIGNYSSQALVTNSNYVYGTSLAPGYTTTTAPNPDLGWEIASSLNIGVDLGFLRNKLNLSAAWYKTNTKDLLLDVPVPQQTGYNTVLANIGEMENRGLELQLSGDNFQIGNVRIGFNANLTLYSNKVIALGPGQTKIATGTDQNFVTKVGEPIAQIYGYNIIGIYKTQEDINKTPHLDGTLTGDHIVQDVNQDGKIDVNDKVAKGSYAPRSTYGFGSSVSYRGFVFSFNFMGVGGRTLLDGDMSSLTEAGEGFAVPTEYYFKNRYHPVNNPNGFLGQPNFGNFSNARKLTRSSVVVEKNNGDYFRLKDIRLSYDLPKSILQFARLSQVQLYASANNLFTITKFRGWNPDGTSTDVLTSGFNNGANYPVARTILFGIRVTY